MINQPSEEKPPPLLCLPHFCASPEGIYFWVSVVPSQPKQVQYHMISSNADGGMLGPETTFLSPLPLIPLAQAPNGLLLNFLVEGAFSPVPFLVHACSLSLFLAHSPPAPIVPSSRSTSSLHPAAAAVLKAEPVGAEALRAAATLPGACGSGSCF